MTPSTFTNSQIAAPTITFAGMMTEPTSPAHSSADAAEAQIEHYAAKLRYEIDSWDLSVLLKEGSPVTVIDARSPEAHRRERIPGAISLPHRTMTEETTANLDRSRLTVAYCDGIGCNGSTKGALNLARLGFNVRELIGGLDWWKRDGHATEGDNATPEKSEDCGC